MNNNNLTSQVLHWKLDASRLTNDYIAGFVQADGSFSATLTRKTRGEKEYFNISLGFTIVQSYIYKDLILEIQKRFGGIGHWYLNKSDKTIRYQVTNQKDLLNVIIPFFMKYQLRSGKLLSFLHFKHILEVMTTRAHWNNKKVLLGLIVLASHMNPLGKLGNKIRLLTSEEQKYVINNVQPDGVDISALTESIANFKQNELTLDFINGLFDGDGNLSAYFVKPSMKEGSITYPSIRFNFSIAQDIHNLSLLDEIKSYFDDKGGIHKISDQCVIYKAGSKLDIKSVILPKMSNINPADWGPYMEGTADLASSGLRLPVLKYNKVYYSYKILELLGSSRRLHKENINEVIALSYYIRQESANITLEKYIGKVKEFLL